MQATGRTPIPTDDELRNEQATRQRADDQKRETRRSLMRVVAKATDVVVKRAPVSHKGELPHTRWDYHERITTGVAGRSNELKRSNPASRMDDDRLRLTRELEHEIARNVRQCIKNIMSLANGVPKGMGIDDAYDRLPDRAANEYVINRVLGRPATKKLMADPPPSPEKRIDLSRVPQDRLDIMEKWLEEAESGEEAGGNYG